MLAVWSCCAPGLGWAFKALLVEGERCIRIDPEEEQKKQLLRPPHCKGIEAFVFSGEMLDWLGWQSGHSQEAESSSGKAVYSIESNRSTPLGKDWNKDPTLQMIRAKFLNQIACTCDQRKSHLPDGPQ